MAEQRFEKAKVGSERRNVVQLLVGQRAKKVRIETKRRNTYTSQVVAIRLIDDRHCHRDVNRLATIAIRGVANVSVLDKDLNFRSERDPIIASARTVRA
jgi:hypothetical protein